MSTALTRAGTSFWSRGLVASLILMTIASGCDNASPGASASTSSQVVTKTNSEELLRSALNLLREEQEGGEFFDRGPQQARSFVRVQELLNQWLQTGGSAEGGALDERVRHRLQQVFESDEMAEIEADRFHKRDAEHLRNCFLLRDVATRIQSEGAPTLDRARSIFDWVQRNVHPLVPEYDGDHLPLGPYNTLLTGRGDALEQAWLFMALLRQLKIDAVLVAHAAANDESRFVPWAVGVLDANDLYVFNFQRGRLGVDASGEQPLTLRAAAAQPDLLLAEWQGSETLDPTRPAVFLESDPSYWAPRMQLLESKLAGSQAAMLSDSVERLVRRVTEATGEVVGDRIILWPLPIAVWRQLRSGDPNFEQAKLQSLGPFAIFAAFINIRVHQLRGDWPRAIRELQDINVMKEQAANLTRLQRDLLDQAAEAATYWLGLCVFEQGEFELAADWLQRYLDRYGRQGRWSPSAQALLDQALAHGSSPAPGP